MTASHWPCVTGKPPVGAKRANALGFHDMHGNVSEWCEDLYGSYEYAPSDGTPQREMRFMNPYSVFRGGNYNASAEGCQSGARCYQPASASLDILGFRVALSAAAARRRARH